MALDYFIISVLSSFSKLRLQSLLRNHFMSLNSHKQEQSLIFSVSELTNVLVVPKKSIYVTLVTSALITYHFFSSAGSQSVTLTH